MNESITAVPGVPAALHRGKDDLPWVSLAEGVSFQLLQADVEAGSKLYRRECAARGLPAPDVIGA